MIGKPKIATLKNVNILREEVLETIIGGVNPVHIKIQREMTVTGTGGDLGAGARIQIR